jgi:hypothetical protein
MFELAESREDGKGNGCSGVQYTHMLSNILKKEKDKKRKDLQQAINFLKIR